MKFVGLMNNASVYFSRLTWSNSVVGTKKKKKKEPKRNFTFSHFQPNPNALIEAEAHVGIRALPTFLNFSVNIMEVTTHK